MLDGSRQGVFWPVGGNEKKKKKKLGGKKLFNYTLSEEKKNKHPKKHVFYSDDSVFYLIHDL